MEHHPDCTCMKCRPIPYVNPSVLHNGRIAKAVCLELKRSGAWHIHFKYSNETHSSMPLYTWNNLASFK